MPFFFEMYRIEENVVHYQLCILLVASCGMNSAKTTVSTECYLLRQTYTVSSRVRTRSHCTGATQPKPPIDSASQNETQTSGHFIHFHKA